MKISRNQGWGKFGKVDEKYFSYVDQLLEIECLAKGLTYKFPAYAGHVNQDKRQTVCYVIKSDMPPLFDDGIKW